MHRFKYQFDPRNFAKVVASRAEEAQDSAKHVAADLASGTLDPAHEAFAQGMYDLAPKIEKPADKPAAAPKEGEKAAPPPAEDAGPKFAPNTCWSAERVAHDLELSRRLIRKLDAEKSIAENPLLPKLATAPSLGDAGKDGGEDGDKPEAGAKPEGGADGEGGAAEAGEGAAAAAAPEAAAPEAEPPIVVDDSNYQESVGKLDLQLHWLWKVHGVDYYAGIELNEQDWPYRLNCCRLIRGPKPEEGEGEDEATAKADREKLGRQVDETWNRRISLGDPIEAKCMKARVSGRACKGLPPKTDYAWIARHGAHGCTLHVLTRVLGTPASIVKPVAHVNTNVRPCRLRTSWTNGSSRRSPWSPITSA